ncbi:MAG: MG2 domain-containing protein, partial [Victivallaceae bacterium]|nr:MG2 domain-containing protein [Victivallaceae bacterium]
MKKILIAAISAFILYFPVSAAENRQELQDRADKELNSENWKDAFYLYKKILMEHGASPLIYTNAVECLIKARLQNEFDGFFSAVAQKYGREPEMAMALAGSRMRVDDYGHIIAGEFVRGPYRGGDDRVSCLERDRVEALRLLLPLVGSAERKEPGFKKCFYETLSGILVWGRGGCQAWKLQYLTDLNKLPDYEKINYNYLGYRPQGAPVGVDGKPVFYHVPESFDAAFNDGELWRGAMAALTDDENIPAAFRLNAKREIADFFKSQFGVETIAYNMRDEIQAVETGPYALHLLKDDETIATLASGVRKIKLPGDCNYLEMYKQLIGTECSFDGLVKLAEIYRNRRQYVKAVDMLREIIRITDSKRRQSYIDELKQITGNWVQLLDCETFPAGARPTVNLKFRNATKVSCKLTKVKIKTFLDDIKEKLKDDQARKEMFKLGFQPQQIGNWLLDNRGKRYLDGSAAQWDEHLKPPAGHFDGTVQFKLPVSEAGVYFLEATAEEGNTSRIIVWLSNTALLEREADGGKLYIVTDALTGKPLDFCRMRFFGYKAEYIRDKSRRDSRQGKYELTFDEFSARTDAEGMAFVEAAKFKQGMQYMLEAGAGDYFGVLGFSGFYCRRYSIQKMNRMQKVYGITDRPIYKPGQMVNFNYWLRVVGYERDDFIDNFSGRTVKLTVRSPRRKILEKEFKTDNFGAFSSSFTLPGDADLGTYSISLDKLGGNVSFRVEEYRKPEYEVKVMMPEKTLMLGEEIPVTVEAAYLFGAPVVNAEVKYKVYRSPKADFCRPLYKWDWLYGPDACNFSGGYFYRSWQSREPVELVADNTAATDAEGKLTFIIDTSLAKALFGNEDSEYKVSAEVTDQSRYTETGEGTIIAACKPFRVYCDADKGFYRTGELVSLTVTALDANRREIAGSYTADLYRITYDAQKTPLESKVKSWSGKKTEEDVKIQFRPDKTGHYLVRVKLTDARNNSGGGDVIVRVLGQGVAADGSMGALPLELVADKKTYAPGDIASIMIGAAEANQEVYLFVRPSSAGMINY